jgi:quinol monooxygenase YgiN
MRLFFQLMLAAVLMPIASLLPANAQGAPPDGPIHVHRYIEVTVDAKSQVPALLAQLAEASRKEAGVLNFEILQRPDPASQFLTVEAWKDQKSLDAHMAAPHTKQFLDRIQPMLVAPIDDRFCFVLEANAPAPNRAATHYVVTHVDVNPPGKEATDALLKALAPASRKDEGNVRFDVFVQNSGRFNHYQVVEAWSTQKAGDAHDAAAHTKEFRTKLSPLNGALYDQRWYKPL